MRRLARIALPFSMVVLAARSAGAQQPAYQVRDTIAVGGEGGWDYLTVDTARGRLFVTHATHVVVLDLAHGSVAGDIPNTPGVHGVALAPELNRGFTSNGRDSTVTVFDLGSLAVTGRVHVPARNPDAILYEPVTRRVFTFDGGSANATAIDAATDSVLGTIPLDGKPEFSVADGTGTVFVNNEDKGEIKRIDARTLRVTATWPMPGCEEPSGLAMDREHRRLFSVCGNGHMEVVDADAGRVLATLPIGRGVDGVAFDPGTQLAFSSNGEGTMTVVHEESPQKFVVAATVPTRRGARTVALDPRTHRVYTVTAAFGTAPAPTAEQPHPRPPMVPGTFVVLVLEQ